MMRPQTLQEIQRRVLEQNSGKKKIGARFLTHSTLWVKGRAGISQCD
jgi:hypothetical protein